nr:hypothetical protein [Pseudodesulfovibrio sp.]
MSLSDLINRDVSSNLFLKDDVIIDGVPLKADVRDEVVGESERRDGVSVQVKTFYWRTAELSKPKPKQQMLVDGDKWIVSKAEDKSGIVKVQMFRELS